MKQIFLFGILLGSISSFSQTNRINHFSHSGSYVTLNIFKPNDNMGLGCGSVYSGEVNPAFDSNTVFLDSLKKDSNQVCIPKSVTRSLKPINPINDTSKVYNRGAK